MIPFTEIGIIFGVSKGMIVKYHQREQTEKQNIGQSLCVDETIWQHLRELTFQ
jgi:hypothetical protein